MIALKPIIQSLIIAVYTQLQGNSDTMTDILTRLAVYLYIHLRSSHLNSTPLQTFLKANQ
jgi:hypothetical protein